MAYKLLVPADIISSGEIADARISVSSVEQHEAALEINDMGISGLLNLGDFLASTNTAPSEPGHMTRKAYVDAQVSSASSAEETRALAAEAALSAAIAAEAVTARAAEALNASDLSDYETSNDSAMGVERARIDAILSGSQADKDSFAEIVTLINTVDTANDQAFAGYVTSNNAALAQAIADFQAADTSEASTARAAELVLTQAIAAEAVTARTAEALNASDLSDYETSNDAALAAEAVTARAAELVLTQAIAAEAVTARAAEAGIASDLSDYETSNDIALASEASTARAAEQANATAISAEAVTARAAEAALTLSVSDMDTAYKAADAALDTAYKAADSALAADYDSKIAIADARAQAAELVNATAISAEAVTARAAEQANATAIAAEAVTARAAEAGIASDLSDYETSNDAALAADVAALASYQTSNDAALAADVAALASYQTSNDAALAADVAALGVERARIDAILSGSQADKDSFAEIVSLINTVDTANDQAFAGYVLSNDAALAQAIADRVSGDTAEAALRVSGDASIQSDLDAWKGSHVIGTDTQAHSSHLGSMEQGDFSTRQMKVKFQTAAAGQGLVMGGDSFFVMCEAGSTVTLPAGADVGRKVQLKAGVLGGAAVTVVGMIDGQSGMTMSLDYASMSLVFSGSTWLIG